MVQIDRRAAPFRHMNMADTIAFGLNIRRHDIRFDRRTGSGVIERIHHRGRLDAGNQTP